MPKLNLFSPITPGAQAAEADQGAMKIINGYVDKLSGRPVIKTRPGLTLLDQLDSSVRVDTFWWEAGRKLIIASAGKIWYKTNIDDTPTEITPAAGSISYNARVFFSGDEYGVTMSSGIRIIWWDGETAEGVVVTDSNAPNRLTSLTYLKGYTLAGGLNTQTFHWATYGPTDSRDLPPPWSVLTLSASAQPDDLICLDSGWEELFLLGRESVESQYVTGDATVPFRSLQGSVGEVGIVNSAVLKKSSKAWIFLTPNRQVVMIQGRTPKVVSQAVEYAFREMDGFKDVEAMILFDRFYLLNFYAEKTTFVYDTETSLWYNWLFWNTDTKTYSEFIGVTSTHAKEWGRHIVGGKEGQLYMSDFSEVLDNDTYIRGQIISAHIDHGTLERKFVDKVKLRLRRGY